MSEPPNLSRPAGHPQGDDETPEYDGELDPRVQEELERLNQSSNQINQLETSLNKARNDYRFLLQVR